MFVAMLHTTNRGEYKIVKQLDYPVTGLACVKRIFTDMAVIDVTPDGLLLREVAPGFSVEAVQQVTEPRLTVAPDIRTIRWTL